MPGLKSCPFCRKADFGVYRTEINKHYATIATAGGSGRFPKNEQFKFCPECGRGLHDNAVNEEEQRALTLDELKKMDGKPIWFTNTNGEYGVWGLVASTPCGYVGRVRAAYGTGRSFGSYGKEWLAYDREPEE